MVNRQSLENWLYVCKLADSVKYVYLGSVGEICDMCAQDQKWLQCIKMHTFTTYGCAHMHQNELHMYNNYACINA